MGGSHSSEKEEELEEVLDSSIRNLQENIGDLVLSPRTKDQIESEILSPRTRVNILKKILTLRSISTPEAKTPKLVRYCSFVELPEISISDLTLFETIGWGSTGVIKRGMWKGKEVAVKLLFPHSDPQKFRQELRHWCAIRHKNIVEVYAACTNVSNLCIVMEYMKDGSLSDYIREINTQLPEAWPSLYRIAIDIVRAMMHLHSSANRIHRDLKPANILLSKEGDNIIAKLCDFGECRTTSMVMTPKVGTAAYMAPELFSCEQYTYKVDVYSFGVLLWELIAREEPFADIHFIHEIIEKVSEGYRPKIPKHCPEIISSLINDCWHQIPEKRPNFTDILMRLLHIGKMWDKFEVGSVLAESSSSDAIIDGKNKKLHSYASFSLKQKPLKRRRPSKTLTRAISVHNLPRIRKKSTSLSTLEEFQKKHEDTLKVARSTTSDEPVHLSDENPLEDESEDDSYDESDDESDDYLDNLDKIDANESHHIVDINLDDEFDESASAPLITITPSSIVPPGSNPKDIHNQRYKLLSSKKKNLHSLLFSDSDLALIRRHRNVAPVDHSVRPTASISGPVLKSDEPKVIQLDPSMANKAKRSLTLSTDKPSKSDPSPPKKDDDEDADQLMIQILKIALRRESEKVKQLKNSNDFLRKKFEQQQKITEQLQYQLQAQPYPPSTSEPTFFNTSCASLLTETESPMGVHKTFSITESMSPKDVNELKQFLIEANKRKQAVIPLSPENLSVEINFSDLLPESSPFFYSSYSIWYFATYLSIPVKLCIIICGINMEKLHNFRNNVAKIQRITNHPNLVSVIGVVTKQPNFCVVYQKNDNYTEISTVIGRKQLNNNDKYQLLKNLCTTMEYCHCHGVVIGQFNPRSIFIHKQNLHKIKLLHECDIINYGKKKDFSWSKYRWLSPELIKPNSMEIPFTTESDIYTLGLVFWYILAEQEPFHTLDAQEVAMKLETSNYQIDIPRSWPTEISDLLNSCWKLKPEKRPTISELSAKLSSFGEFPDSWSFPSLQDA